MLPQVSKLAFSQAPGQRLAGRGLAGIDYLFSWGLGLQASKRRALRLKELGDFGTS